MKKLLTLAAILFILGTLTGCKEGGSGAQEQPQQKTEEQQGTAGEQGTTAEQPASESEGAGGSEGGAEGQ